MIPQTESKKISALSVERAVYTLFCLDIYSPDGENIVDVDFKHILLLSSGELNEGAIREFGTKAFPGWKLCCAEYLGDPELL